MIVKVQVSLWTQHEKPQMLIYNQDRSLECQADVSDTVAKEMAGAKRAFYEARLLADGTLELMGKLGEQGW